MSAALLAVVFAAPTGDESFGRADDSTAAGRSEPAVLAAESALVARLQAGDEEAYREVVAMYADRLRRFAFSILRRSDLANDLTQDVLAHLWDRRATWQLEQSLKAYLFAAIRNRALDVLKHQRVQRETSATLTESIAARATQTPDIVERLSMDVLVDALRKAVAQLPERRRTALRLRYEEGLTYPMIAAVLGVSVKSAEQLVALTVQALRKELRHLRQGL